MGLALSVVYCGLRHPDRKMRLWSEPAHNLVTAACGQAEALPTLQSGLGSRCALMRRWLYFICDGQREQQAAAGATCLPTSRPLAVVECYR